MNLNYKRKDLIKIIKARQKNDYKYLFKHSCELLGCLVGQFQKQKNYDFDETFADFIDCSTTSQCDDLK
jgi:hypothetical protein